MKPKVQGVRNASTDRPELHERIQASRMCMSTFSSRIEYNVSRYLGVTLNRFEKEKKIIEAAELDPQSYPDLYDKK